MQSKSIVLSKAKLLAVKGIHFARFIRKELHENDISRQLLRSITAPGALIAEATDSESSADMRHKFGIALKECRESQYWIEVLIESGLVESGHCADIQGILNEVTAILVTSRKTLSKRVQ